jgi:hypothetical protein
MINAPWYDDTWGGVEVQLRSVLTSARDGGE